MPRKRRKSKVTKEARRRWNWLPEEHKQQIKLNQENYPGEYTIEKFTCAKCDLVKDCEYAFELYNTDGDCLLLK